jgi:hypothetical protein
VVSLGLRPQVLSTVFLVFTYAILIKRRWWYLVPLSLIWANIHGAFILEPILMSLYFGQLLIKKDKELIKFGLIACLVGVVSLINPFGTGIYEEAFRHSWYPLNKLIAEWLSPGDLGIVMIFSSVISILAILSNMVFVEKKRLFKKENILFLLSSFLVFLGLAFMARRNLSLFGVAFMFVFFEIVKLKQKDGWWSWLILSLLTVFLVVRIGLSDKRVDWSLVEKERGYPMGVIEYLKNNDSCQNIYNTYEWGGYLVWKLPEKKFFVDGRMPTWDNPEKKSPYTIYLEIIQARSGWSERVIGYGTDCLLISKGTFLDLEIRDETKSWQEVWEKIFEDEKSVLYQLR